MFQKQYTFVCWINKKHLPGSEGPTNQFKDHEHILEDSNDSQNSKIDPEDQKDALIQNILEQDAKHIPHDNIFG